jgi:S-disulfanyl-L-cysteine oxidoreductase SoxD
MCTCKGLIIVAGAACAVLASAPGDAAAQGYGGPYGFGTTPTAQEIAAVDIDAMPDGRGLPSGAGTYEQGREVYLSRCAGCHAETLEGIPEVGGDRLIGGRGSLTSGQPVKTVESYWPYAPTLFDYVKRAMPFDSPGALTDDEVYAVTAFILGEAGIIAKDQKIDAQNLARIEMPNRDGFVPDPRPDVFNYE